MDYLKERREKMTKPSLQNLLRRALLDYYKEQGLSGKELYRRVIVAMEEHNKRRRKWNARL